MMRMMSASLAALLSLACGPVAPGETTADTGDASTTGDASAGTSSGATAAPTTGVAPTTGDVTTGSTGDASTGDQGTGGASTGSFDPIVCAAAETIGITSAKATPVDGPTWSPGEAVTIEALLFNAGTADFNNYPGIRVTADRPDVVSDAPENWLFALFAGMENSLPVVFTADPAAKPGPVTFTIEVVVLGQSCPDLARLEIEAPLDPA